MTDPNLIVGTETGDDAAVYRLGEHLALVQTVDFFMPVVDDPYEFGQIAAANSLSDVYAMGGRPITAMNIVGWPKSQPMSILSRILQGGQDKVAEAGAVVVGGHTVDYQEPTYGLSVTGLIHPKRVVTNAGARPGDVLVLTKPLGTGVITTGIKSGEASSEAARRAVETMSTLNRAASEAMQEVGVDSATDITGFGLLGHLGGMCAGSRVGARVRFRDLPLLPDVEKLIADENVPGGTRRNLEFMSPRVVWEGDFSENRRFVLADAQTSGGMLIAVPREKAKDLIARLDRPGVLCRAAIGEIVEDPQHRIFVSP